MCLENDGKFVIPVSLSNNTISRRIDEISESIEMHLVDESALRDNDNNISMKHIPSCAEDGVPIMVEKKNDCLKLMKD
ncbi:hypothetical protein TNCV_2746881 [Trichonephila clavipes]|nr:hypothetical protein TNCV_2746881 [Trichonephila clavipes]